MAPIGETAPADVAAGLGDEAPGAAGPGKKGSYIPPALRAGARPEGDRLGGKYGERDDMATLRVTNVSYAPSLRIRKTSRYKSNDLQTKITGLGACGRIGAARDVRALRPCHSCVLGQGPRDWSGQGLRLHQLCGSRRRRAGMPEDGRLWFQAFDPQGRVCQEGSVRGRGRLDGCWLEVMGAVKIEAAQYSQLGNLKVARFAV